MENKRKKTNDKKKIKNNGKAKNKHITYIKTNIKKNNKEKKIDYPSSSSSSESSDSEDNNLSIDKEDGYNPSLVNEPLRSIIVNHMNISPDNLYLIENNGSGNC